MQLLKFMTILALDGHWTEIMQCFISVRVQQRLDNISYELACIMKIY